jgi:hypothetical protein
VAHLARHRRLVIDRPILLHAAIVAAFIALFFAASWQNLLRLGSYSGVVSALPGVEANSQHIEPYVVLTFYATTLIKSDPVLLLVGGIGLLVLARRAPMFLLLYGAIFGSYALVIVTGYVNDDRYILPLTPVLAIAAGALIGAIWRWRMPVGVLAGLIVVAFPLAAVIQFDRLLLRDDTRILARDFLITAARQGGVVSVMKAVRLPQDMPSLDLQAKLDPDSLNYRERRRLAGNPISPQDGAEGIPVLHLHQFTADKLKDRSPDALFDDLKAQGYRWFVRDDFTDPSISALDVTMRRRGTKVAVFAPSPDGHSGPIPNLTNQFARGGAVDLFRVERLGPVVEVWQMK